MKIRLLVVVILLTFAVSMISAQASTQFVPGDAGIRSAAGNQQAPAISQGGNVLLAVWSDSRANPTASYEYETSKDIYGLRLDTSGNLLDTAPMPIAAGKATQDNPQVAWNGSNWLVVFESYDLNGTGYYYQKALEAVRVASTGQVLDSSPIKLYGLTPPAAGYWAVASDGVNWVVVNESTSTSGDIVAVRISPDGILLDPPIRSLVDATYYMRSNIKLAFANGVFLMTFDDEYINGTNNTKAVRFDSNLNLLDAAPIRLLDVPLASLASNGSTFYIVWHQQQPDYSIAVTGSRLDTTAQKLDGNGVNISATKQPQPYTTTAVVWDGSNWRITWGYNNAAAAARVNASGQVLDPGGVALSTVQPGPTAGTGTGNIQVLSTALSNNNYDVSSSNISSANTAGPSRTLSLGAPRQLGSDVESGTNGYMLVYLSGTASQNRVLAQPLNANGNPLTTEPIQLDAGDNTSGPGYPNVAWNGSVYMAVWANSSGVVAQRLQADGAKIDAAPFIVMSTASKSIGPADVAALGDTFLVAARQVGFNIQYIFPAVARVRGSDGAVLDATPLVLGHSFVGRAPAVAALGDRWLIAWHRNATHDDPYTLTQGAFVGADGSTTPEFQIHGPFSTAGGNGIFELALASNGSEALMVQSQELSSGVETDLLGRFIQADGTVSAMTNLTPWIGNQYRPRVAWDGTNFVIVYQDQKNRLADWTLDQLDARSDLFGIRLSPAGTVIDPQGFVFSASPTGETDPNIAAQNGVSLLTGSMVRNDSPYVNYRVKYDLFGTGANQWPVAIAAANPTSGDIPLNVSFSSSGSTDPDGSIVSYAWDFGDGATATQPNPSHTYTVAGSYVATLTVTDNLGATTTQTALVKATAPNQLPVASASAMPMTGPAPLDVTFFADGSYDPDGFIGNIHWTFSDGGEYWGSPAYHTFNNPGTYTATLTVYDSRAGTGTTTLPINVGTTNQPPLATVSANPISGAAPLAVSFSSSGSSDPDGTVTAYLWDFGDGATSASPNPSHTYTAPGVYNATLTVTDNWGATGTASLSITANGLLRSTAINLSAKLSAGKVVVIGIVTVKDASGVVVPGATVLVTWRLPGGATVQQSATTDSSGAARFSVSGTRGTYTLTVNDITKPAYTFDRANSVLTKSIKK